MENAIKSFNAAAKCNPKSHGAWSDLGVASMRAHRLVDAKKYMLKALAMKPDSEDIASNIKDLKMWFKHQKLPWHEDGNAENAKAKTCQKHKNCTLKEFCSAGGSCQVCKQCQDPSDSYNGKCPCGPGKKKNKKKGSKKAPPKKSAGSLPDDELADLLNDEL